MEQINLFIEKVQSDSGLKEKLETILKADADADEIVAVANEAGFDFTTEDWNEYLRQSEEFIAARGKEELTSDELEGIAGGEGSFIFSPRNCWFEWSGTTRIVNGKETYKCKAKCTETYFEKGYGLNHISCRCYHTGRCIDKFHHKNNEVSGLINCD